MYLVGESTKDTLPKIKDEVNAIVTTAGAELAGESIEFDRKLAYEIKHQWRGTYVVLRFTLGDKDAREEGLADGEMSKDVVGEITRQMNLHKDVLRYIVVNAEDLPTLAEYQAKEAESKTEDKKVLKEKGEKIDGKLKKALKI